LEIDERFLILVVDAKNLWPVFVQVTGEYDAMYWHIIISD